MDPQRRLVEWNGVPVELTSTEFNIMKILARSIGGHPIALGDYM